ncbi:dye-decolorizing peroxidase YfeX-like [Physella acuta]|uniref:dye-decolorizing peroxidase YfeX-like n=1 Tax=Physella acuta TaxID=109671 RepID=UPI0027DD6918|nr:dye-decolorizing peroxidase YfeX-like [Physella acuta]
MLSTRTLCAVKPCFFTKGLRRQLSTKFSFVAKGRKGFILGSVVAGLTGYGLYETYGKSSNSVLYAAKPRDYSSYNKSNSPQPTLLEVPPSISTPPSQPSVWTPEKDHALYLWIHLKPTANVKCVAKVAANLPQMVNIVNDPETSVEDDEVLAGVGFGAHFYTKVAGKPKENFTYLHRKGPLGEMPSTGGDIFVHAKSNNMGVLFDLCQLFIKSLPESCIESFEDIYSFQYRNGRDLSGFIDGTENPADEEDRQRVAVDIRTGGSYVLTQKWIHNLHLINNTRSHTLESWVGRTREDSVELERKSPTSHVARMTSGEIPQETKPFELVRQSMPFGNVHGDAGLFFIAYAASPANFEYMLDRMVGAGGDALSDDIMRMTKNVKGTYWYFPGKEELYDLAVS